MYGVTIGDLAGSIYEYDQTKGIKPIEIKKIDYHPNFKTYFKYPLSPSLIEWIKEPVRGKTRTSIGNGAMMRISPRGSNYICSNNRLGNILFKKRIFLRVYI